MNFESHNESTIFFLSFCETEIFNWDKKGWCNYVFMTLCSQLKTKKCEKHWQILRAKIRGHIGWASFFTYGNMMNISGKCIFTGMNSAAILDLCILGNSGVAIKTIRVTVIGNEYKFCPSLILLINSIQIWSSRIKSG